MTVNFNPKRSQFGEAIIESGAPWIKVYKKVFSASYDPFARLLTRLLFIKIMTVPMDKPMYNKIGPVSTNKIMEKRHGPQ